MTGKKTSVLFLCTGNSCRSQMAEGFARQMGGGAIEAYSAGTNPVGVNPRAIQVMKEAGIDLSTHFSKPVEAIDQERIEVVVTLCGDAAENCPTFPGAVKRIHWPLEDPARAEGSEERIMAVFRATREAIRLHVAQLVENLEDDLFEYGR
jgi:arsenate reductase (thioredoxin)